MRMRNFGSIQGHGNLTHVARQSRRIFAKYGVTSEESLRQIVLKK
jgi:hypothetical protein